jgi:hypothetical protein
MRSGRCGYHKDAYVVAGRQTSRSGALHRLLPVIRAIAAPAYFETESQTNAAIRVLEGRRCTQRQARCRSPPTSDLLLSDTTRHRLIGSEGYGH